MNARKAAAIAAGLTSAAFLVAVVVANVGGDDPDPEMIPASTLKLDVGGYVDRAGTCDEDFIITRSGVPTALLTCAADQPPPTTTTTTSTTSTTTTPPAGDGYPSLATVDFNGDFDANCNGSQWSQQYNEGTSSQFVNGEAGDGACWAKLTSNTSGKARAEFGSPVLPANTEVVYEFLVFVPSGVSHTGYIAQNKMDEIAGSCANGGWSMPDDLNGQIALRVRSDCNADHRDLNFGAPPHDRWFAVKAHVKYAQSGGFARAWMDPDGAGPAGYGAMKEVTGDTSSGGNVKHRLGVYGSFASGKWVGVDGYHRDNR